MNTSSHLKISLLFFYFSLTLVTSSKAQSYLYNFDSGTNEDWVSYTQSGSSWERGTPTAAGFSAAYTTPSCWGTDLDSGYRGNTIAYLTSPMMLISNLSDPYLSFWQFRYMSFGLDGFHLEYSTNGTSWQRLTNGLYADNWYNTTSVYATSLPGFTGNSSGWKQSGIHLNYLGHIDSIKVRFVFNSYIFGSSQPGVLIDQINLSQNSLTLNDMSALAILSPTNAGSNSPITIQVKNNSIVPLDSFIVGYVLNGVTTSSIAARTIAAGATDTITIGNAYIPTTVNSICVFARGRNDYEFSNDSICSNLGLSTTYPVFENFDSGSLGWTTISIDTITKWQLGYPNYAAFVGAYSGNSCWDVNLTSDYGPSAQTFLYSPVYNSAIPFTQLKFKLRYEVENNYDGMHVEYTNDNGVTWNILGTYNDPNGINWYNATNVTSFGAACWTGFSNSWVNAEYNLSNYAFVGNLQFRFVMHSDNFIQYNGVSIDDFYLSNIGITDLRSVATSTTSGGFPIGYNTGNIGITVSNLGSTTINSFILGYKVNGAVTFATTVTGVTLTPGTTTTYYLPGYIVSQQVNTICGYCQLSGDQNQSNDTSCTTVYGTTPLTLNYEIDFESGNAQWYPDNTQSIGTNWELGFPLYNATTNVHSGSNAWDVNLTTPYSNNANVFLYSPIFDLTNTVHPKLSFWQNRNCEDNWDGLRVEINYGFGWGLLGNYGDLNGTNWYTDATLNSSSLPGWSGNSLSWHESSYKLDAFSNVGSTQFRFVFTSDNSLQTDGVSIDDFSVTQALPYDGALLSATTYDTLYAGYSYPLSVYLQNVGINNLTNASIQYQINGVTTSPQPWSGNLALDSTTLVNLQNFTPVAGWNSIFITLNWPNDQNGLNNIVTIYIYGIPEHEASLESFTAPSNTIGQGTPTPVTVILKNNGGFPITSLSIKYTNNNGVPLNYNWSGFLPTGVTTPVTLPSFIPSGGTNLITAYIDWNLDANHNNDTISMSKFAMVTANLTYNYDFENGDQGWYDSTYTNYTYWELGYPSVAPTNAPHSGNNCWDINLTSPYFNVAYTSLFSPLFVVSNYSKVNIDFWLNIATEYAADGVYLEYSLDGGAWEVLGTINDPNATNWYNTTMFGNNVGWTGLSNGWQHCAYSFNNFSGGNSLQLKFVFRSDINIISSGVSLDDITLSGVVGLNENSNNQLVRLSPNPSNQECQLFFPSTTHSIELLDGSGKRISTFEINNENTMTISTLTLEEGFYLIRLRDVNGNSITKKLQVIH